MRVFIGPQKQLLSPGGDSERSATGFLCAALLGTSRAWGKACAEKMSPEETSDATFLMLLEVQSGGKEELAT